MKTTQTEGPLDRRDDGDPRRQTRTSGTMKGPPRQKDATFQES